MVVVAKSPLGRDVRRRRRRAVGILVFAVVLFAAGAIAQRAGLLSGVLELVTRIRAVVTHPQEVFDAAFHDDDLPVLRFDVKWSDMRKIEIARDAALRRGLLVTSGDDFVPAVIRVGDRRLRAKIRLKGDILDHIVTSKWSFRVHLRGEDRHDGMRRFSIQHPKTRNYLHEWGFLETMRLEEILAPRYSFARVVLNGKARGIYAVEEAFARELFESQQRREGLVIRLDENPLHQWFHDLPEDAEGGMDVNPVSDMNVAIEPFDEGRVAGNPTVAAQWARARTLLASFFRDRDVPASAVFDARVLGRFLAVCELWGALHPLRWGNVRFFYDPLGDRIEPVAYDGSIATPGGVGRARLMALGSVREGLPGEPWTRRALEDPAVAESYLANLHRMLSDDYVSSLEARLGPRWRVLARTLGGEFPGEPALLAPWDRLRMRARMLAAALAPPRHLIAFRSPPTTAGGGASLDVAGVLTVPVEITAIEIDGVRHERRRILPGSLPDRPVTFVRIDLPPGPATEVRVDSRVLGFDHVLTTVARVAPGAVREGIPPAPSEEDCLRAHPFLVSGGGRSLLVRPGRWDIEGDLVLPAGHALVLGPGTTLRFAPGKMLLARGPVVIQGSAERPVTLEPREDRWAGVAVIDAGAVSRWEHAIVRGTSGVRHGGWSLTAGVTFHLSPIALVRCRFDDHAGSDDQLNIFRSTFLMSGCEFSNCTGDSFDGDFVEGEITDCSFHDVGGDALDFSGSRGLDIRHVRLSRIADKAVSAGEDSHLVLDDAVCEDVSIGVAAKDRSHVAMTNCRISGARFALAAYRKKPEYGPASIDAGEGVVIEDSEQIAIIQTGSSVILHGRPIAGQDVDVHRLYEEGILGN